MEDGWLGLFGRVRTVRRDGSVCPCVRLLLTLQGHVVDGAADRSRPPVGVPVTTFDRRPFGLGDCAICLGWCVGAGDGAGAGCCWPVWPLVAVWQRGVDTLSELLSGSRRSRSDSRLTRPTVNRSANQSRGETEG